tara:strand:- start:669 stop:2030 length:1362 start_codon:yes stop_codon:yes gene_type:complete
MKPNIVFLIIDSFRADKFFTSSTSKQPNINELIKNGTYFSNAFSTSDATILSWASIFTGKHPFKTGIRSSRFNKLDDNTHTLFDHLKNSNYSFYGFLPTFSETIGLFPNFKNSNFLYDYTETIHTGLGEKIISLFSSLSKNEPWFMTIHLLDLHFPLLVPEKFNSEEYGFSKYEKIISSIDEWLGTFLKNINFENTILVITADHGTYIKKMKKDSQIIDFEDNADKEILIKNVSRNIPSFLKPIKDKLFFKLQDKKRTSIVKELSKYKLSTYEKRTLMSGLISQDHMIFDDSIHIPLLFVGKNIESGKKFSKQVSLVDIVPTIAYLVNDSFDYTSCDGKNLLPLKNEEIFEESPAYIESNPLIDIISNDVIGIRTSDFKYFRDKNSKDKRVHLYDLTNDVSEECNCAQTNPAQVRKMEEKLQNLLITNENNNHNEDDTVSTEIENELRKMGYV